MPKSVWLAIHVILPIGWLMVSNAQQVCVSSFRAASHTGGRTQRVGRRLGAATISVLMSKPTKSHSSRSRMQRFAKRKRIVGFAFQSYYNSTQTALLISQKPKNWQKL